MAEPESVWLTATGSYSSEQVTAVFATQDLALRYTSGEGWADADPDSDDPHMYRDSDKPYVIHTFLPDPVRVVSLSAMVYENPTEYESLHGRGVTERRTLWWPGIDSAADEPKECHVTASTSAWRSDPGGAGRAYVAATGSDHERVRKAFSERLAEVTATITVLCEAERLKNAARQAEYEARK